MQRGDYEHGTFEAYRSGDCRCPKCKAAAIAHRRMVNYGVSQDDYDRILRLQDGGCAVCGAVPDPTCPSFAVDHDHATGAIRAILCNTCNSSLGLLDEDPERIRLLMAYAESLEDEPRAHVVAAPTGRLRCTASQ